MKTTIYCPDIECDSCVNLLSKKFEKAEGIKNFSVKKDSVELEYDEEAIKTEDIITLIKSSGFRASTKPFERKTFKERVRHIKENKHSYIIELTALKYSLWIFLILLGLQAVAYFGILKSIPDFLENYGLWLLYLDISIASIGGAMWHFYSYRTKLTCMLGMMVGMTFGMQAGMMIGAVLGATNGFFTGALVGMLLAVFVGAISGKCCGIMGVIEGMMAGVMGGTMGPMISVMMFSDNIEIFMPFYILINVIITSGLLYMLYEEAVEGKEDVKRTPAEFSTFASICIMVTFALVLVMIYGPKSPLIGF